MSTITRYFASLPVLCILLAGEVKSTAAASDTDACDFGACSVAEIRVCIDKSMLLQGKC